MQDGMNFKYARLYDAAADTYVTDQMNPRLTYGPETKKRMEENTGCAVTVCCITYKHEEFIRQALDSFLMQKTSFKFQVFVGEDCGPDGTADIVREYAEKYPDVIVPFLREKNMGAQRNLIDLCNHANSPYIAFCEGDDYWTDEYKLQKQFDYMQAHEDLRMCYTNTEILAPEDWHLNGFYKHNSEGKMILPGCTPDFLVKEYYTATDFIRVFPTHTSSAFYRWNYDLDIPNWYFEGLIGDTPITLLQMGMGKAVYLPDVTSVYRRSDVGVFMNHSIQEHFINTRLDYVRFLSGIRSYFGMHYGNYLDGVLRWRIRKEIYNYLSAAKKDKNSDMVQKLFAEYPSEGFEAMHSFLGAYSIYSRLQRKMSPKWAWILCETRLGFLSCYPMIWLFQALRWLRSRVRKLGSKMVKLFNQILGLYRYWTDAKKPKEKNLWVFSGFRHANYMDNTMYLYEYILKYHPEINAVWLTTESNVIERLRAERKPVCRMNSKDGRAIMSAAEIAVTDHFAVSDYAPYMGFNHALKVVQLWHGVGFKSMGNGTKVKNTAERGVRYSNDILPMPSDGPLRRLYKKVMYFFKAPFRELFEQYFLFVCPGQERIDTMAKVWNIPMENCIMAGHPRDLPMYEAIRQEFPVKIMYAPTYRFNVQREVAMIQEFLNATPQIQALMEEVHGEFYLRMHPHTWRNYKENILKVLNNYDRIFLHEETDVYQDIGTFSIIISDYSSIALDFANLGRPAIFHTADYDWFVENEAGFNVDFPNVIPGPMTTNWKETLKEVRKYIENPEKDAALRQEKLAYFFDKSANGPDNSERIVAEIKRRIGLD